MSPGVHLWPSFFHKRGIWVVELQFTLDQIVRSYEYPGRNILVHSEIVGDETIPVEGKTVAAIKVARQGGNVIVLP